MPKAQLQKIIDAFAALLTEHRVNFSKLYLYGSHAVGNADKHSDIDVAVVVKGLKRDRGYLEKSIRLRHLGTQIDPRIEPILLDEADLGKDTASIMGSEVRKHGIVVARA